MPIPGRRDGVLRVIDKAIEEACEVVAARDLQALRDGIVRLMIWDGLWFGVGSGD